MPTINPYYRLAALWDSCPKRRADPNLATVRRDRVWVEKYPQGYRLLHYRTPLVDATPDGFTLVGHDSVTTQKNLRELANISTWRRGGNMMWGRVVLTRGAVEYGNNTGNPRGDPYVLAAPKDIAKLDRIYAALSAPDMPMAAGGLTWGHCKDLLMCMPGEARSAIRAVMRWAPDEFPMSKLTHEVMHHAIVGALTSSAARPYRRSEIESLAARYGVKLDLD